MFDISDPENPKRISEISNPNFAYWHGAMFNNDATKIVFSDEWGGGGAPKCRAEDPETWGADLIADITENGLEERAFFKIPGVQSATENCVAHNGALLPIPGRDIIVQSWYAGGISVIDFTDSNNPFEIAFYDRGPINAETLHFGGYWSAYWHNGRIYGTDIIRGLDVLKLVASEHLSEAEIAVAEMVTFAQANSQTQELFTWEASPTLAQAYLDQLRRDKALPHKLEKLVVAAIANWGEDAGDLAGQLKAAAEAAEGRTAERMQGLADALMGA